MLKKLSLRTRLTLLTIVFISLLLAVLSLTACSSNTEAEQSQPEYDYPESYMIESDNVIAYQDGMQCAAFSSAYLLRHFGEEADGMEIFENFPNRAPDGGIFPNGIVSYLEEKGYQAEFKQVGTVEELKQLVSKGTPVIVFIHTKEPYENVHSTHYIPMIGYDKDSLYFAESIPELANCKEEDAVYNRKTDIAKFERLWLNIDGIWDNPYIIVTDH